MREYEAELPQAADELALEFDDRNQLVDQLQALGVVSSTTVRLAKTLSEA